MSTVWAETISPTVAATSTTPSSRRSATTSAASSSGSGFYCASSWRSSSLPQIQCQREMQILHRRLVRGHCAIRRFGLHALGDHWLIGHEEQRAGWNVVGKSRGTDRRSLHVDRHAPCARQLLLKAIIVFPDTTVGCVHGACPIVVTQVTDHC